MIDRGQIVRGWYIGFFLGGRVEVQERFWQENDKMKGKGIGEEKFSCSVGVIFRVGVGSCLGFGQLRIVENYQGGQIKGNKGSRVM